MGASLDVAAIQEALREAALDGWLFFDHHHRDPLAYRVLKFSPAQTPTRRWYYFVPAHGEPTKLVHKIESRMLDALPGRAIAYAGWVEQREALRSALGSARRVAMQYSPDCAVPYVAMVDAGTVELVRALGCEVASSADLIQRFEAVWSGAQFEQHIRAGRKVDSIRSAAFDKIADRLRAGSPTNEFAIKQFILESFQREGLFTDHGPIVAVNENASDPHYEPTPESSRQIGKGDLVLIDLWAKLREPSAVYYDITWTGYCGADPPSRMDEIFAVVAGARDRAVERVRRAVAAGETIRGFEVDDACREHIRAHGLADAFFHRTGHSIGEEVHGTGANMDNLETHDERQLIRGTCFSIEPGVYLPEFGIRSELNVHIGERAMVTGEVQSALLRLLP
ncbi:MAG: M24 family metallopeptidase [Bryobacteraceae bacterium]|nr:M24 family metallopeptidase [Bryobacteraceae bacterium]